MEIKSIVSEKYTSNDKNISSSVFLNTKIIDISNLAFHFGIYNVREVEYLVRIDQGTGVVNKLMVLKVFYILH